MHFGAPQSWLELALFLAFTLWLLIYGSIKAYRDARRRNERIGVKFILGVAVLAAGCAGAAIDLVAFVKIHGFGTRAENLGEIVAIPTEAVPIGAFVMLIYRGMQRRRRGEDLSGPSSSGTT